MRDPFLVLRLGRGSRLRRKLEHCCLLTFNQVGQEHALAIWKLQRVVMRARLLLVDLPEDGYRVIDGIHLQAKQPTRPASYLLGKGKLRSRKNTNRRAGIFRRSEPSSAGVEVAGSQFVANLSRT